MRGLDPDPRQAERLGHGGHDRDGAIRGHRQHAVDLVPPGGVGDRLDVGEVDDLALVGRGKARRFRVAVDGDDAQPELARALDRTPLVPPRTDHEDRSLHSAAMLSALNG